MNSMARSLAGPGPGKRKSSTVHEPVSGPNYRDASNTSGLACPWTGSPTPIPVPAADQRSRRFQDNPYFRTPNTLKNRHPGNPISRQTILGSHGVPDSHVRKRQKHERSPATTLNGASSSHVMGPVPRGNISEPEVQLIEPPCATSHRSNPVRNDAEIIEVRASSDDLGEHVPRAAESSSPDPLSLFSPLKIHAFQTHPTQYNSFEKGKGRAKEFPEWVEGSEEGEDIEEFTPPPSMARPLNSKNLPGIPTHIVQKRRTVFEGPGPAAIVLPIERNANTSSSTTTRVVSRMKGKDEGACRNQKSTNAIDCVGTSSSNFLNSTRKEGRAQTLPLQAWCLGHHHFQHSDSAPLELTYEPTSQQIRVSWGRSSLQQIEFKLERDVLLATAVNESTEPLKGNAVIQFKAKPGPAWRETQRRYKGFKPGNERGKGQLTFLLPAVKDRGLTATDYRKFVSVTSKALKTSSAENIRQTDGTKLWEIAHRFASMFEQRESRNGKEGRNDNIPDERPGMTRSVTPCSSTSVKNVHEFTPLDADSSSYTPIRRSARQSAMRTSGTSPIPLQPKSEPDEVILMYPPTGTGALSIMHSDLRRLQPEEYLNDTLIEFGLKLWLNDLREENPVLADQIHVFSSFFYKKLNNRKSPEDGYKSVRKWTSRIELFTKKYIIVPINENIHWYLAIIYEPGHTLGPPLLSPQLSRTRMTRKRTQEQDRTKTNADLETSLGRSSAMARAIEGQQINPSSTNPTRTMTPSTNGGDGMEDVAITISDKSCPITAGRESASTPSETEIRDSSPNLLHPPSDHMDVDADPFDTSAVLPTRDATEALEPSTSKPTSSIYRSMPKDVTPAVIIDNEDSGEDQQQEAEVDDMLAITQPSTMDLPSQTYIFTLDSLGSRHPQAIKVLRQYLEWEAKDKCNFDEVRDAVGKQVQVPVQPNTWDCGIYLLHFVKIFMSNPMLFLEQILSTRGTMPSSERRKMWQDHEIPQFRDYLKTRIVQLSEEWKAEKTVREGDANKSRSGDAVQIEELSSEGEVDIVEDIQSVKVTPGPRQKQAATRLRG